MILLTLQLLDHSEIGFETTESQSSPVMELEAQHLSSKDCNTAVALLISESGFNVLHVSPNKLEDRWVTVKS